jgi:hypothetical protein
MLLEKVHTCWLVSLRCHMHDIDPVLIFAVHIRSVPQQFLDNLHIASETGEMDSLELIFLSLVLDPSGGLRLAYLFFRFMNQEESDGFGVLVAS